MDGEYCKAGVTMDLYPYFEKIGAVDKTATSNLEKVNRSDIIESRDPVTEPGAKKHENRHGHKGKQEDEAAAHFESLKTAADLANSELEKKNLPYRFYIYREFDEIFVNLVLLDKNGNIVEVKKKNITHQEFADLIQNIQNGEGLFYNTVG